MSNPFTKWYWNDRLKAGKFPDIAFGAFPFYDTLNYGMACSRLLGFYIQSCVQVSLAGKWLCILLFLFDGRDT